jgi:hypothetical protein
MIRQYQNLKDKYKTKLTHLRQGAEKLSEIRRQKNRTQVRRTTTPKDHIEVSTSRAGYSNPARIPPLALGL